MATYTPKKTVQYSSWQAKRHVHIYHAPLVAETPHAKAADKTTAGPKPDTPTN